MDNKDNQKTNEKSTMNNSQKNKKGIIIIAFLVIIVGVILVVAVSGKNKTTQNDNNNQNTANEQVNTEVLEDFDVQNNENDDNSTQDEQNGEIDENVESYDNQTMSFSEIKALEENSDDFNSNLVIKAHEIAQKKYKDKTLSLIYSNGEDSKVTVNGKECYQITITEENEDPEKESEIIGYMAISLEDEKVYYRDVNGNY